MPYSGDVVLFRAKKQFPGPAEDAHLGWQNTLHGIVDIYEVSGHQQNVLLEPNVLSLAEELSKRLEAAHRKLGLKEEQCLPAVSAH
jgi:thioesterase domain-containing protein